MYDFFIAHAGADVKPAERLFDLLSKDSRVFLDTRCLKLGDQWDQVLPRAQRQSRVTVVIVSPRTEAAFYQQEEVAAAIDLAKRDGHRVVPVYIEGPPKDDDSPPYGLRRLHSATISKGFKLEDLARKLLAQRAAEGGTVSQRRRPRQRPSQAQAAGQASPPHSPRAKPQSVKPQSVRPVLVKPLDADRLLTRRLASEPVLLSDPSVKVVLELDLLRALGLPAQIAAVPEGRARLDITEKGFLLHYTDGKRGAFEPSSSIRLKDDSIHLLTKYVRLVFTSSGRAAAAHNAMKGVMERAAVAARRRKT